MFNKNWYVPPRVFDRSGQSVIPKHQKVPIVETDAPSAVCAAGAGALSTTIKSAPSPDLSSPLL